MNSQAPLRHTWRYGQSVQTQMGGHRPALVLHLVEVEGAVHEHGEAQAGAGAELQHPHAAGGAVAEREEPHARGLPHPPRMGEKVAAGEVASVEVRHA